MNKIASCTIALWLLVACSTPSSQFGEEFKTFNYKDIQTNAVKVEDASTFFKNSSEYIELKMTDKSMVGFISKVSVTDSSIFILAHDQLMAFDRDGSFKTQIGKIGQGPEEVVSMTDFTVDEINRKIYVFDTMGQKIAVYDIDNNYLTSIPFGGIARNIEYWNNQLCASSMNFLGMDPHNFVALNSINGDTLVASANPVRYSGEEFFIETFHPTLQSLEKELLIRQDYNDTIYTYQGDMQNPTVKYVFDFDNKKLSYDILRNMKTYEKRCADYVHLIDFMESPELILVAMMDEGKDTKYVIDKLTGKSYALHRNALKDENGLPFWPTCYSNGVFVSFIMPDLALEHKHEIKDEKVKSIIANLKEDSNPILVLSKVK